MMCYRDRTYCSAPCVTVECSRCVTPEIEAASERSGMPLALSDFRDTCGRYVPPHSPSPREGTP